MTQALPSVVDTRELHERISTLVHDLCERIRPGITYALFHDIPVMEVAHRQTKIAVTRLEGDEAIAHCLTSFRQLSRADNQDPRTSQRFPGVLVVRDNVSAQVEEINRLKTAMAELLAPIQGRQRREFMREALPNISTHHLTRHIHEIGRQPQSLGFTWSANSPIMRRMTYDQVIAECERRSSKGEIDPMDLERLATARGTLYERRLMAPHPRINLYYGQPNGTKAETIMVPGHLPLIVRHDENAPAIKIHYLQDFDESTQSKRAKRKDSKRLELLIPHLSIYEHVGSSDGID